MSRTKILILAGSSDMLLGLLLYASVSEVAGLLLLGVGILILLAGCLIFCWKGEAKRVMLAGAVISGVSLIVIPALSLLLHFDPNVHDWTGFLFFLWVLSCAAGPVFALIGASRFFVQKRRKSQ